MTDDRFPKADLLQVKVLPKHWMKVPFFHYVRIANASQLRVGRLQFAWRRSWLQSAVYMEGWNACWRELYYGGRLKEIPGAMETLRDTLKDVRGTE